MTTEIPTDIAIGVAIESQIHSRSVIKTQTCIARDCSVADINALFDKITAAIDRQRTKYLLKDAELELEKEKGELAGHHADFEKYENDVYAQYSATARGKRNGDGMPEDDELWTGQYKVNRDNKLINIKGARDRILSLEKQIEEYRSIVGG